MRVCGGEAWVEVNRLSPIVGSKVSGLGLCLVLSE